MNLLGDSWKLTFSMLLVFSILTSVKAFIIWKILLISFHFDISIEKTLARFGKKCQFLRNCENMQNALKIKD